MTEAVGETDEVLLFEIVGVRVTVVLIVGVDDAVIEDVILREPLADIDTEPEDESEIVGVTERVGVFVTVLVADEVQEVEDVADDVSEILIVRVTDAVTLFDKDREDVKLRVGERLPVIEVDDVLEPVNERLPLRDSDMEMVGVRVPLPVRDDDTEMDEVREDDSELDSEMVGVGVLDGTIGNENGDGDGLAD